MNISGTFETGEKEASMHFEFRGIEKKSLEARFVVLRGGYQCGDVVFVMRGLSRFGQWYGRFESYTFGLAYAGNTANVFTGVDSATPYTVFLNGQPYGTITRIMTPGARLSSVK